MTEAEGQTATEDVGLSLGDLSTFPEEWKQDFEGLAYIGHLEKEVTIPCHTVVIRTLLAGERLEVVQICKDFEGTIGYNRAFKAASVAAALVSVDDQPLLIAEKKKGAVRQKYQYVINTWHDPVIDVIYEHVKALENRVLEVMKECGFFD